MIEQSGFATGYTNEKGSEKEFAEIEIYTKKKIITVCVTLNESHTLL